MRYHFLALETELLIRPITFTIFFFTIFKLGDLNRRFKIHCLFDKITSSEDGYVFDPMTGGNLHTPPYLKLTLADKRNPTFILWCSSLLLSGPLVQPPMVSVCEGTFGQEPLADGCDFWAYIRN